MEPLRNNASLADLQDYMIKMEAERGLSGLGIDSQCLKLGEELGELYDAALAFNGTTSDGTGEGTAAIASELVDALILTVSIANRCDIDLRTGLRTRTGQPAPSPTLKTTPPPSH